MYLRSFSVPQALIRAFRWSSVIRLRFTVGTGTDMTEEEMFADGIKVRKAITDKYPGWMVMGYCPKEGV